MSTLDKAVRYPWDSGKELFPSKTKKKASEPEGPEAVIPVISLVALLYGDAETAPGGTRRYQSASPEASSRYSHSFTLACCSVIPVKFCPVVGLDCLAAESCRASSHMRLGQALGQLRKLFRNREPAVSFLSRGQKREGFEALKRPLPDQAARWNYEIPSPRLGPSVPKRLRNPRSLVDAHS